MKTIITAIFALISLLTTGQNQKVEELGRLYMSRDLEQTIQKANDYLKNDPDNIDFKLILGRALTDKGEYKAAMPYLEYTAGNDLEKTWRKAWALGYLGTCQFMIQDYNNSQKSVEECYNLNATKNATQYAHKRILLFGFDDFYKDWKIVESDNFRFHFQNMSDFDITNYVASREAAFQNINKFFQSKLPKKIDFFVWHSKEDAQNLLRTNLGFADPEFCVVHSHYQQTKGHEMTHVISNYSITPLKKTGLINEGTSVCFDQTNQDREQIVKNWLKSNNRKIAIKEIWTNWNNYPEELTYPLSGIFVKELINNFGREKFIEFFGDQTYENAKSVFGDKVDLLIQGLENKVNF